VACGTGAQTGARESSDHPYRLEEAPRPRRDYRAAFRSAGASLNRGSLAQSECFPSLRGAIAGLLHHGRVQRSPLACRKGGLVRLQL